MKNAYTVANGNDVIAITTSPLAAVNIAREFLERENDGIKVSWNGGEDNLPEALKNLRVHNFLGDLELVAGERLVTVAKRPLNVFEGRVF